MLSRCFRRSLASGDASRWPARWASCSAVDPSPRLDTRYTLWSGCSGGFFVALAYFGTDQSQVQRYLAGGPLAESRRGLLMNGLLKVPMQLFILFIGVMVFVVYQLTPPPLFFNRAELERVRASHPAEVAALEATHARLFAEKRRGHRRVAGQPGRGGAAATTPRRACRRCGRRPARWWPAPGRGRTPRTRTSSSSASCSTTSRAGSSGCWWRSSSPPRCPPTPRPSRPWGDDGGRLLPTSPSRCV